MKMKIMTIGFLLVAIATAILLSGCSDGCPFAPHLCIQPDTKPEVISVHNLTAENAWHPSIINRTYINISHGQTRLLRDILINISWWFEVEDGFWGSKCLYFEVSSVHTTKEQPPLELTWFPSPQKVRQTDLSNYFLANNEECDKETHYIPIYENGSIIELIPKEIFWCYDSLFEITCWG